MKSKIGKRARAAFDSKRNQAKLEKEFITSGYTDKEEYIAEVQKLYNKGLTMSQATNRVKLNKKQLMYIPDKKLRKFLSRKDVQEQLRANVNPNVLNKNYDPIKAAANTIRKTAEIEKRSMESAMERFIASKAYNPDYTSFDRYRISAQRLLKKMAHINVDWKDITYDDGEYYLPDGTRFKFERPDGESKAHLYIWNNTSNSWIDKGVAFEFGVFSL